jgi:TRAP-type transport system periplasmic protein
MIKKMFLVPILVVLVLAFAFSNCAQPASTPAPSPSPAPAPAPAQKPIELKFAHIEPPVSGAAKLYEVWANKVKEQSGGKVTITIYPANSLASPKDMWASMTGGVCDIGFVNLNEESERLVLNTVMKLPALGIPEGIEGMKIWQDLSAKFPEMAAEYKDMKMLFAFTSSPSSLHTIKKEVKVPEDIRGMKITAASQLDLGFLKLAGASPIGQPAPDWYMSLDRGLSEALMSPYQAMEIFGTTPLFKYHVDPAYGPNVLFVLMSINKWNSLSPDIQKVFDDLKPWATEAFCQLKSEEVINIRKKCEGAGQSFTVLTPEQKKLWADNGAPMTEDWIKKVTGQGKPGSAVVEEAKRLAAKYSK